MQKVEIDYSNTIIYKITCNDPNVKDVYVGHTTNFVQRKQAHKQSCINEKSINNKCKLYDVIRNNGGWMNWKMEIIHFCNCNNQYEARIKEQEYFVLLNANLNSIEPMRPNKAKHVISTPIELNNDDISNLKDSNYAKKYVCDICDFKTSNKKDYTNHLLTAKHINFSVGNIVAKSCSEHKCVNCDKIYKSRVGLWGHKKKCKKEEKEEYAKSCMNIILMEILKQKQNQTMIDKNTSENNNSALIIELIKQNQQFKEQMIEQNKYILELIKNTNDN